MDSRTHPFAGKLSLDQAEEVRRLRARGVPLANLADRFGIAKSSVSAIVKHKAHEIPGRSASHCPSSRRRSSPSSPRTKRCPSSGSRRTSSLRRFAAGRGDRPEAERDRAYQRR